jgi:isopenicillin-N epimerase
MQVSWGYHYPRERVDEPDEFGTTPRLRALEFEGTRDPCPWMAIPDAIDFQAGLGWDRVRTRQAELVAHVRRRLAGVAALELATPPDPRLHGTLTAFRMPAATDLTVLRKGLWSHRIEVNVFERPEGPILRVSTHFYNTEEEVDQLAKVLPELLAAAGPPR